jgi:alpha-galactosidase
MQGDDEYAAGVFNVVFGDGILFKFSGNVRNFGLIDNLPIESCVEVPLLASKNMIESIHVGPLPTQVSTLNNISISSEELAVEGALTGDLNKIYQACYYDPLSSAVLSMDGIKTMVKEMFEANKKFFRNFKCIN